MRWRVVDPGRRAGAVPPVLSTLLLAALATALAVANDAASLELGPRERVLLVAPHPDDETIGRARLNQRVLARGGMVRVVLVTAGDGYVEAVVHETGELRPRPAEYVAYGERRLAEARAALRRLGGGRIRLEFLGFPDGGLVPLLGAHLSRREPERSPTTAAERPPYRDAVWLSALYDGDDLRRELVHVLRETQPTIVVFPDPLDRHPDHHASGMFALLALAEFTRDGAPLPRLLAYLVHGPSWPPGWDTATPDARAETGPLAPPSSLPDRGLARVTISLDGAEEAGKREALALYRSQQQVMPALLAAFVRRTEPFTVFTADEVRRATDQARREGLRGTVGW